MTRSVLAVLAGIVTLTALDFAIEALADPLLMQLFPQSFPTPSALRQSLPAALFMLGYGAASVAAGGYVAACLAGRTPLRHAASLGIVQSGLTVGAMIGTWNHAPALTWIVTLAMTLPCAVLGGGVFAWQQGRKELHLPATAATPPA